MSAPDDERLALAGLARVTEAGYPPVHRAVESAGAVAVFEALQAGRVAHGLGAALTAAAAERADGLDPAQDLRRVAEVGGRLVCPGDEEWPGARWDWTADGLLEAPPLSLYVRGVHSLQDVTARSVAVVGARAATPYGVHVAAELSLGLCDRGWAVVSGGAYGIDAAAHRGALASTGAPTVAVLACGVDVAYPSGNDRLLAQVGAQGLLVSELPPGSHPTRRRFLVRNRLIAALTVGTVVVEAAARSGSLATLERARLLNRLVMAVPGPVTSPMSTGCHQQLRTGALCVSSVAEILDGVGALGVDGAEPLRGPSGPRDGLSETVCRVLDALPVVGGAGIAGIARDAALTALVVQQVLPPLLVHGLVERSSEGWRLTALGAGRPVGRS